MVNNSGERCQSDPFSCPVCGKPADKRCSACQSISYCCADHQKRHWKTHKTDCRCYTVKRNDKYGRYLVATRDIPQGTIILTDEPLVVGPKRCTTPVCLGCHKPLREECHRCSKCRYPMCSEKCESAPIHVENECAVFQRATHPVGSKISNFDSLCPAYECITPLRCLLLKSRDEVKWGKLTSMEHHNELRRAAAGFWNQNHVNVVKLLLDWYKMRGEFDEETVHSVIGFVDVNSFEIKFRDTLICGIYREAAMMSHDCVPNTHNAITVTEDHRMIVRSSVPIKKGELVTTSYASILAGTVQRRNFLRDTKYFDCDCRRCADPTEFFTFVSAIKCGNCTDGYLLPKDPTDRNDWVCTCGKGGESCGNIMNIDGIQKILRKATKQVDEARSSTAGSTISRLEHVLKKLSGSVLHPNHNVLLSVVKDLNYLYAGSVVEGVADMDRLSRAKQLCTQMLGVLDLIDPGLSRLRGVTLYQMSKCDLRLSRLKFQSGGLSALEYKTSLTSILAYLETSREIMELDNMIVPNSRVYSSIVEHIGVIKQTLDILP